MKWVNKNHTKIMGLVWFSKGLSEFFRLTRVRPSWEHMGKNPAPVLVLGRKTALQWLPCCRWPWRFVKETFAKRERRQHVWGPSRKYHEMDILKVGGASWPIVLKDRAKTKAFFRDCCRWTIKFPILLVVPHMEKFCRCGRLVRGCVGANSFVISNACGQSFRTVVHCGNWDGNEAIKTTDLWHCWWMKSCNNG